MIIPNCSKALCAGWILLACAGLLARAQALAKDDAALAVNGAALLRGWVQPAYPEQMRREKKQATVTVDLVVDEQGVVTEVQVAESGGPEFDAAALAAVRQWKFQPALDEGRPVASGLTAPVVFSLAQLKQKTPPALPPQALWPVPATRRPARVIEAGDPEYPEELEERKLPGRVDLEIEVDAAGRVGARRVRWASHGAFVAEALRVAERWTFEPARQGLLATPAALRSPVRFACVGVRRPEIFAANGLRLAEGEAVDVVPEPAVMTEPVYPLERLLAGEEGVAEASFSITPRGYVEDFAVTESTLPEFGAALAAAVDTWHFQPGFRSGNAVAMRVVVRHEFRRPTGGKLGRLVALLGEEGGVAAARGLDGPLLAVWRGFPAFPRTLRGTAAHGSAEIEFVIDRDGRARLPRVMSASAPEFGWAAATAVAQWVFAPPRRGGEPVEVRVQVPLEFSADK